MDIKFEYAEMNAREIIFEGSVSRTILIRCIGTKLAVEK